MNLLNMEGLRKSLQVLFVIYFSGCRSIDAHTLVPLTETLSQALHPPVLPEGYDNIFPGENVAYKIYEDSVNWGEARGQCITDKGDLAIIDTSDKIKYIKSVYSGMEESLYVGIRKLVNFNEWITVNNTKLSAQSVPWAPHVQTDWALGSEICATIKISEIGLVPEEDCMTYKGFICGISLDKYQLPTVTETAMQDPPSPLLPEGYSMYSRGNVAYKIYEYAATWEDARSRCILDGGNLAVTDTSDKIQHIQNSWTEDWLFVGIYKPAGSDKWKAVGEVDLSATSIPWASWTMLNIKPFRQYCAAIVAGESNLSLFDCTYSLSFVCEIRKDNKSHAIVTVPNNAGGNTIIYVLHEIIFDTPTTTTTTTIRPPTIKTTITTSNISTILNLPDGYVEFSRFRTAYKLYEEYLTHDKARGRCFLDGGRLAVVDSFEKINSVSAMLRGGSAHVGIRTSSVSFQEWVIDSDGEPLQDLPWTSDNPHPMKCAVLNKDGNGLEDAFCSDRLQYLCEIRQSND